MHWDCRSSTLRWFGNALANWNYFRRRKIYPSEGTRSCGLGRKLISRWTRKERSDHSTCCAWTFLWLETHVLQSVNQKSSKVKISQFWKELRGLRQAKELFEDFDCSRSKVCRSHCMKNVSGCWQISYGELYLHKLGIIDDVFCRICRAEEETQRHVC